MTHARPTTLRTPRAGSTVGLWALALGLLGTTLHCRGSAPPPAVQQAPAPPAAAPIASAPPAAAPSAPLAPPADGLPTDQTFQDFVQRYTRSTGEVVSRWWSVDLDGNGRLDRIAFTCYPFEANDLMRILVQSDTGVTHRMAWLLDGRNDYDLCETARELRLRCEADFCSAAKAQYAKVPPTDPAQKKLLEACATSRVTDTFLPQVAQGCTLTPKFESAPKEDAMPLLTSATNSGRREDRLGLRDGVPVIVASSAEESGRHDTPEYKYQADFDKQTLNCTGDCTGLTLAKVREDGTGVASTRYMGFRYIEPVHPAAKSWTRLRPEGK